MADVLAPAGTEAARLLLRPDTAFNFRIWLKLDAMTFIILQKARLLNPCEGGREPRGKSPVEPDHRGKFIQCIKHGVEMTGIDAEPPHPPREGLNKKEQRHLDQTRSALNTTIPQIVTE